MPQTANIRAFRRSQIPQTEQIIGGTVLVLLIGIGVGIYLKGQSYDPATYTGDVTALESTRQAVEGKAATLREQADLRAYEQATPTGAGSAKAREIPALVAGIVPMGPTEVYNETTLFEKINGRAPAYLEYNFQLLTSRSFSIPDTSAGFIDVYLYEMDSPLNAFGIFSVERNEVGQPLDYAIDGYKSEMGYFMRVGTVYAQVLASSTEASIMEKAGDFTRELSGILEKDNSGLEGRAMLSQENQVPGSLNFINENAYGQAFLSRVFEAKYDVEGTRLTVFAQATDPQTARANWETLRDFYSNYGSVEEPQTVAGADLFVADMFGQWSVIYQRDDAISGVVEATDRDAAVGFVTDVLKDTGEESNETEDYPY